MPSARILLVEPDATAAQTIGWVLREHGYEVIAARTAGEMVDRLSRCDCDLVLLDLPAEGAGGRLDPVRQARGDPHGARVPLVVMGEALAEDDAVGALSLGAGDVVRKPLRMRELLARLQAQLRAHHAARAASAALVAAGGDRERMREVIAGRQRLMEILHELTGDLSPDDIHHVLTRRLARALDLSHSALVLARPGDRVGVVATSVESPGARNREISLVHHPEVRAALDRGRSVLVADVGTSPLFEGVRAARGDGSASGPQSVLAVPFVLERVQAGVVLLGRSAGAAPPFGVEDAAFAETVVRVGSASLERARLLERAKEENARLSALAQTDPLTHVLNRRALTARLTAEIERARRYDECVTLLLVDLDHFKRVNDTFGHLAGDEVLRELASLLREAVRTVDVVARFGGEEFVVILPETALEGGRAFAERLRERIAGQAFSTGGRTRVRLTASVGVACYPGAGVDGTDALLARADAALYRAKEEGRDRVRD